LILKWKKEKDITISARKGGGGGFGRIVGNWGGSGRREVSFRHLREKKKKRERKEIDELGGERREP